MPKENLSKLHKNDLELTRKIICQLIQKLDNLSKDENLYDETPQHWKYIWGEKENVVSSLTKLTGLLLKIIPLEQSIKDDFESKRSTSKSQEEISKNDQKIIDRYVQRQIRIHNKKNKNKQTVN